MKLAPLQRTQSKLLLDPSSASCICPAAVGWQQKTSRQTGKQPTRRTARQMNEWTTKQTNKQTNEHRQSGF